MDDFVSDANPYAATSRPDALVRLAAWVTAGDGLVPLVRAWAVCTALFLIVLSIVLSIVLVAS